MVTKLGLTVIFFSFRSVLAKIHMVTKPASVGTSPPLSSVLAKIHMVTKPSSFAKLAYVCSVLAKIHMVTKHRLDGWKRN